MDLHSSLTPHALHGKIQALQGPGTESNLGDNMALAHGCGPGPSSGVVEAATTGSPADPSWIQPGI